MDVFLSILEKNRNRKKDGDKNENNGDDKKKNDEDFEYMMYNLKDSDVGVIRKMLSGIEDVDKFKSLFRKILKAIGHAGMEYVLKEPFEFNIKIKNGKARNEYKSKAMDDSKCAKELNVIYEKCQSSKREVKNKYEELCKENSKVSSEMSCEQLKELSKINREMSNKLSEKFCHVRRMMS
ncbi:hypothetical protein OCOL_000474 [Ordospora colligata]